MNYGWHRSDSTAFRLDDGDALESRDAAIGYVERQNLIMQMNMRRFTRLTNAFSKKLDNHRWAVALYFMHYNFCRVHQTLRVTPAMEAGTSDHVCSVEEIVNLLDDRTISDAA